MGDVLFSIHSKQYFIIIKGELRYSQGNSFYNFIKNMLLDEENNGNTLIDLRECTFLDSTNLGLIAKIANHAIKNNKPKPVILSVNKEINALLESLGFNSVFYITSENFSSQDDDGVSIEKAELDVTNMSKMILDAHKELTMLNDKNKDIFKDVVNLFAKENE